VTLSLRWAEVDLGAVSANCALILEHLPKGTQLFAVVKANGYGHGAVPVAHAALEGGATRLAVATLEEATQLRGLSNQGILVMGGLLPAGGGRRRVGMQRQGLEPGDGRASTEHQTAPCCRRSTPAWAGSAAPRTTRLGSPGADPGI
jgi:hypothetical protein